MKTLTLIILSFVSFSLLAGADRKHYDPSVFEVVPLNSPVKVSVARFLIKTPSGFELDEVTYKVKNASRPFEVVAPYRKIDLISGPQGKEIQLNVSKLPPGFFQLFVKVKDKGKKEYEFKTRYKDHAMFVIDESLEVPMPNSKMNDSTVAGVDSDNDGIRDDIQRWVNETYSDQPKTKLAMKQAAAGMQLALLSVADKNQSIVAAHTSLDGLACLKFIVGVNEAIKLRQELESKLINTKDRHYADIKSNANFSGQSRVSPSTLEDKKAFCAFNPDSL